MLRVIRPCVALAAAIVLLSVAGCTTASNPEQAARDISVKYLTDLAHGKDLQSYLCKGISGTGDWTRGVGIQNVQAVKVTDAKKANPGMEISGEQVTLSYVRVAPDGSKQKVSDWRVIVHSGNKSCVWALFDSTIK
jgi:hypothetical protein